MSQLHKKKVKLALMAVCQATNHFIQHILADLYSDDSSSSDDEDFVQSGSRRKRRRLPSEMPRIRNFITGVVHQFNDNEFQSHFRLSREAFEWLLQQLAPKLNALGSSGSYAECPQVNLEKQLLSVLWILATPDSYRSVAMRFDMGKGLLHRCFCRVIRALNWFAPTVIKWPDCEERLRIRAALKQYGGIDGAVGVIDGTYVCIKAPKDDASVYVNRKCFYGITLQGICDDGQKFIHAFAGYPSSVSDVRIFRNSDIYKSIEEDTRRFFSPNEFLLGDEAYETKTFCVPPYREGKTFTQWQKTFNHRHASTRQVIERTFALYFGRFRRLKDLDMTRTDWIPGTIIAACVLHNICLMKSDDHLRAGFEEEGIRFLRERDVDAGEVTSNSRFTPHTNDDGKIFRDNLARQMGLLTDESDNTLTIGLPDPPQLHTHSNVDEAHSTAGLPEPTEIHNGQPEPTEIHNGQPEPSEIHDGQSDDIHRLSDYIEELSTEIEYVLPELS